MSNSEFRISEIPMSAEEKLMKDVEIRESLIIMIIKSSQMQSDVCISEFDMLTWFFSVCRLVLYQMNTVYLN